MIGKTAYAAQYEKMRSKTRITHDQLHEALDYDPLSGEFTWRASNGSRKIGSRAGGAAKGGIRKISLLGVYYPEHRLAWFYVFGEWPERVYHINGDGHDNRFENLTDKRQVPLSKREKAAARIRSDWEQWDNITVVEDSPTDLSAFLL